MTANCSATLAFTKNYWIIARIYSQHPFWLCCLYFISQLTFGLVIPPHIIYLPIDIPPEGKHDFASASPRISSYTIIQRIDTENTILPPRHKVFLTAEKSKNKKATRQITTSTARKRRPPAIVVHRSIKLTWHQTKEGWKIWILICCRRSRRWARILLIDGRRKILEGLLWGWPRLSKSRTSSRGASR